MRITWNELTVSLERVDTDALLSDWRWLVPADLTPLLLSTLGDLFLQDPAGRIYWLSTGWGELQPVADSPEQFKERMVQRDCADEWFAPLLIRDLLSRGMKLQRGECLGYKVPPVLGGPPDPDNFEPTSLLVHFSILGQIHRQVKDLPPGAPVSFYNPDAEGEGA